MKNRSSWMLHLLRCTRFLLAKVFERKYSPRTRMHSSRMLECILACIRTDRCSGRHQMSVPRRWSASRGVLCPDWREVTSLCRWTDGRWSLSREGGGEGGWRPPCEQNDTRFWKHYLPLRSVKIDWVTDISEHCQFLRYADVHSWSLKWVHMAILFAPCCRR